MRAHYDMILQRLSGMTVGGVPVPAFLGDPPSSVVPPYVFVTPRPSVGVAISTSGADTVLSEGFQVTVVHTSANNTLALQEKVGALLDGYTPAIGGWGTFPLRAVDAQPVRTDTTVVYGPSNLYPRFAVVSYHLQAVKE